jgi:hypothetical protein
MRVASSVLLALPVAAAAAGQELEPRAYSPAPTGTTFVVIAATGSTGGVFTDPSAALTDVEADVALLGLGVGHVFAMLGRSASVLAVVPIVWGEATGNVGEERRAASRRGLADPRLKLSLILAGSRPMPPQEFARAPRRPILGVSFTAVPPMGQYSPSKLVNLGSNRWSLKPEVGLSVPLDRWTFDAYAGVWFFTENDVYYPGRSTRRQDPVFAAQGHVSYTFRRRAWVAVNATWYSGGQLEVNGGKAADPYRNARLGATVSIPVGTRQSVKLAYSAGAATRVGADFRTLSGAWQLVMF